MLAISVDSVEDSKSAAESHGITFRLLSDGDLKTIDAYGVRHEGAHPFTGGAIARPAVFVIDRDGRIAHRHVTDNWRVRVRAEEILKQLADLP